MELPYRFGRYVLLKKIAKGGMAEIFKANYLGESGFFKEVAIKRLLPIWCERQDFIKMLVDEAKALVCLSHPNIVQVYELGRDRNIFYIAMEWVEGITLRDLFLKLNRENIRLPLKFISYVIGEILKALDYAHQKKNDEEKPLGIVHRDISPQNILLSWEGRVKIVDFGIAKGSHRSLETTHEQIKGKYAYMSPEQARGEGVDARTDLYAVGIIFYELLEGKRLFAGVNNLATLEMARQSRLPENSLQAWPVRLKQIIFRGLERDLNLRHGSARGFLKDLNRFASDQKLKTDAREFANYLKNLFPKGWEGEVEKESSLETVQKGIDKMEAPFPVRFRESRIFLGAFCGLIFLGVGVGWKFLGLRAKAEEVHVEAEMREKTAETPVVLEPHRDENHRVEDGGLPVASGSITIDAKPFPLRGTLILDGEKSGIETPFYLGGIDIGREKKGEILFELKNGKRLSESFVIGAKNPHMVKTFEVILEKPGSLMISAKPWGEVTIPGVALSQETPLNKQNLKSGEYEIRVYYPPKDQWTKKRISLASGTRVVCRADFVSDPKLTCR